jgi:D-3-phosphoglycerate dehydrogenase / 2-oxoglutarate reductase
MPLVVVLAKADPYLIETLQELGFTVHYLPQSTREEALAALPEAVGLVAGNRFAIDTEIIDTAPNLKWIGRLGSGMEKIDTAYASTKNIQCISSPEGNCQAVAEHALGLLISLQKNIITSYNQVRQGQWIRENNRGTELSGKTVGIIGYGNTGKAFAKLLQPFGVMVLAYDKYVQGFSQDYVREAQLEQIAKHANIISYHVPLTEHTHYMGNKVFFESLQLNPIIINTSRGEVIDTAALINGLQQNQIAGAALDVLENENITTHTSQQAEQLQTLINMPNVIITPHIAGYSFEAEEKMSKVLLKKLQIQGLL